MMSCVLTAADIPAVLHVSLACTMLPGVLSVLLYRPWPLSLSCSSSSVLGAQHLVLEVVIRCDGEC